LDFNSDSQRPPQSKQKGWFWFSESSEMKFIECPNRLDNNECLKFLNELGFNGNQACCETILKLPSNGKKIEVAEEVTGHR